MLYSTSIGLDVHARSITASALVHETGEVVRASFPGGDARAVAAWAAGLPRPCRAVYESGPTGFALKRELDALGLPTVVGAVTKMLRPSGDRVKTDRRDADFLARMLAVGNVVECWCPTPAEEADRDLSRLREQVRGDLMRARHQLSKLLLRKGLVYPGRTTWTREHRQWLRSIGLPEPEERFVLSELLEAVAQAEERRRRVDAEIARRAAAPEHAPVVAALSGIRGGVHPHRLRPRRRAGRPLEVPGRPLPHVLRGAGALRVLVGRVGEPRGDHEGGQRPREEAPRRGRLAPREAALARLGGEVEGRGAHRVHRGGLREVQRAAARQVRPTQGQGQARLRVRDRRRARARGLRLGDRLRGPGPGGPGLVAAPPLRRRPRRRPVGRPANALRPAPACHGRD